MRFYILIKGEVQGIGFRNFVRILGKYNNLRGYVKNMPNGCVEIFIEGTQYNLNTFISEIKEKSGEVGAIIENIEIYDEASEKYKAPLKEIKNGFAIDRSD